MNWKRRIKDFLIRLIWGNRLYNLILKRIDRYIVEVKPSSSFQTEEIPLNKVCRFSDIKNQLWSKGFDDLLFPKIPSLFHRKIWEFCQIIYGLRKLKRLHPNAVALGVGCGHEELMYFLSNRVKKVYAIDLYRDKYLGGEAEEDVIEKPEKYAPFKFRKECLEIRRMDARDLKFEDNTFDFCFSLSAIEHMGGKRSKLKALKEIYRVLKPGGVFAFTTELILNKLGRGRSYFRLEELLNLCKNAGFEIVGDLSTSIEEEFSSPPLALPMESNRTPHVILRNFNSIYTSFSLFLSKREISSDIMAQIGEETDIPPIPYCYKAKMEFVKFPERVIGGEGIKIILKIKNMGDAPWYRNGGHSHMVRLGIKIFERDKSVELPHFPLPEDIFPGEEKIVEIEIPPMNLKGKVLFHFDLVKELCFWFEEKGSKPIKKEIELL
jgi:SAM-dependent methyltransferase